MPIGVIAQTGLAVAAILLAAPAGSTPAILAYRLDSAASGVDARVGFLGIGSRTAHFPSVSGSVTLSPAAMDRIDLNRSEEHTSELQSLMRISYAVFCLTKKKYTTAKIVR